MRTGLRMAFIQVAIPVRHQRYHYTATNRGFWIPGQNSRREHVFSGRALRIQIQIRRSNGIRLEEGKKAVIIYMVTFLWLQHLIWQNRKKWLRN